MARTLKLVATRTDDSLRAEEILTVGLILLLALGARALVAMQ